MHVIHIQSHVIIYFSISAILSTCPDEYELLNLLVSINSNWFEIGTALKIPHNTLEGLRHSNDGDAVKLKVVIHSWIMTQSSPVTWETVIAAIGGRVVNNQAKVDEIHEHLRLST